MSGLSGRRIVVAGAFGALGFELSRQAVEAGANVLMLGRSGEGIASPRVRVARLDLADEAAVAAACAEAAEAWGGLDALYNAAGAFAWRPFAEADPAFWERLWRANVLTAVCACRAVVPRLGPGGLVVNVAAAAAERAAAGMAAYAAAKAGVLRLTEALAEELAPRGVKVLSVSPAIIDTPANRAAMPEADTRAWTPLDALAAAMLALSDNPAPSGSNLRGPF